MLAHNNNKPISKYASTTGPPQTKIHVIATACACSGGVSTTSLSLPLPWLREFGLYPRLECVNTASVLVIGASEKYPGRDTWFFDGISYFLSKINRKRDLALGNKRNLR